MEFKKVNQLPIDIKEAIKKRVSSRSFEAKSLNEEDKNKLLEFNKTLSNPFGVDISIQYTTLYPRLWVQYNIDSSRYYFN